LGERRHLPVDPVTQKNLAVLHESVFDRLQNVPKYRPPNLIGRDYQQEKYVPLFADAPGYTKTSDGQLATELPDESRFDNQGAPGRVQAILDFKVDANPMLQIAPDMWPKFPIFAALLTIAATLLIPVGERWYWIVGEIVFLWLLRQVFRKLYQVRLVTQLQQDRDELAKLNPSQPPKEPPPFIHGQWKAFCDLFAGMLAAGVVLHLAYAAGSKPTYLWPSFAGLVLLAAGLLPAMVTLAQARAYNAVLSAWADATDEPDFQAYTQRLMQYRRVMENSPKGGIHA
jgi:hypothetical protein